MWLWIFIGIAIVIGFAAFTGAPYVPSKRREVVRALTELYALNDKDVLVDIGSGDGLVLREASRLGARAIGYEIHPLLVLLSRFLSRHDTLVQVRLANFWNRPLPEDTTVVYTFGDTRDIRRMYNRVESEASKLDKEVAFISYAFEVPGVVPDRADGAYYLYRIKPLRQKT